MTESISVFPWKGGEGQEGVREGITKEQEEILEGDRYVHYFNCGNGSTDVYICQNLSHCIFQIYSGLRMSVIYQ